MEIVREQRIALITGGDLSAHGKLVVDDLTSFLQRSLGAIVRWRRDDADLSAIEEPICIYFGSPESNPALGRMAKQANLSLDGLDPQEGRVAAREINGKTVVLIAGATQTGACHAAYSFLEDDLGIGFFIDSDNVPYLALAELPEADRIVKPTVPLRTLFHHSTWKHPHLNCWRLWGIEKWMQSIDWMRRKRYNLFSVFHDDGGYNWGDVVFRAFPEIPVNDKTLAHFVTDPAWRTELNHKIFAYARQSGMDLSYNMFYSQVPEFFADAYPDINYHPLHMQNVGIDARQPECREIMLKVWGAIFDEYGIDDSHVYQVCSYQHEEKLPDAMEDHTWVTLEAYKTLKELDPQARMFIETWCWKYYREDPPRPLDQLTENAKKEWKRFDAEMPKDLGVVEWDLDRVHNPILDEDFKYFKGRPYIQLTHSNFEGWWPPTSTRNHPTYLTDYFNRAIDNGAEGIAFFHIQAGVSEKIADLTARIGWESHPDVPAFYRDYARRRFGAENAEVLGESLELFCDGVDFYQTLSPAMFHRSGEHALSILEETGDAKKAWLKERLAELEPKRKLAARALTLARSVAARLDGDFLFEKCLWELDYVAMRFEGITSLYNAHLIADSDPEAAEALFNRCMDAFFAVKELFRIRPDTHMSELRNLEPDVPFTAMHLDDWETHGFWDVRVYDQHVVWERFDIFEERLLAQRP